MGFVSGYVARINRSKAGTRRKARKETEEWLINRGLETRRDGIDWWSCGRKAPLRLSLPNWLVKLVSSATIVMIIIQCFLPKGSFYQTQVKETRKRQQTIVLALWMGNREYKQANYRWVIKPRKQIYIWSNQTTFLNKLRSSVESNKIWFNLPTYFFDLTKSYLTKQSFVAPNKFYGWVNQNFGQPCDKQFVCWSNWIFVGLARCNASNITPKKLLVDSTKPFLDLTKHVYDTVK